MNLCSQPARNTDAKDKLNFAFVGTVQANDLG